MSTHEIIHLIKIAIVAIGLILTCALIYAASRLGKNETPECSYRDDIGPRNTP